MEKIGLDQICFFIQFLLLSRKYKY